MWWNAKWKHYHWGYLLITPPAVISLPHPFVSTSPSLFLYFLLPACIFPTSQRGGYWQIERGRINCHSAFVTAGAAFFQTSKFGLGGARGSRYGEQEGKEVHVWGWQEGTVPWETKTDCTLLSARTSSLSALLVFPSCLSTILAAPHTNITGKKSGTKGELSKFLGFKQRSAVIRS